MHDVLVGLMGLFTMFPSARNDLRTAPETSYEHLPKETAVSQEAHNVYYRNYNRDREDDSHCGFADPTSTP